MTLTGATQVTGFLLWLGTLSFVWIAVSRRKNIPTSLLWPGLLASLPLAFVMRGLLGDVSLALPAVAAYATGWFSVSRGVRYALGTVICVATLLYVSALGLVNPDLYGRGYFPTWELIPVAGSLALALRFAPALAWCWLLGLGLAASGLHPSPNLWDALIDVPSVLLAIWILIRKNQ